MSRLLSFIVPIKDEALTINELYDRIIKSMIDNCPDDDFEIIFIDDGSLDDSWSVINSISQRLPGIVRAIRFRRNMGKALALEAGFRCCRGDFVFTIDADLQDDPKEIPNFLEEMDKGFDLVSGWKYSRHDPMSKTLPSKIFNAVTAKLTGVRLHDFNCGFKCYRKEVIKCIHIYGEMHRYIPVLVADLGYRVGELKIRHHARIYGESKYGLERYFRGFIDLLTVLATTRWLAKPGHLFGGIGIAFGLVGGASLGYLFLIWAFGVSSIGNRPLLAFGVLTTIASLQMLSLGVIAEFFLKSSVIDIEKYISSRLENNGP
jgi:glycosyltransferase involved in cell wall biosynthesis